MQGWLASGGASGGGVRGFPIDDLPPAVVCSTGGGAGGRSDLLYPLRLRGLRLGSRVRHELPQRGGRCCHSRRPRCRPAPSGIKESPVNQQRGSAQNEAPRKTDGAIVSATDNLSRQRAINDRGLMFRTGTLGGSPGAGVVGG